MTTQLTSTLNRLQPYALAALRAVAGYCFLLHGSAKLLSLPMIEGMSGVPIASLMGVGGILELVGGALLMIGLFTRPVGFLLSGQMAVAYFMFHAQTTPLLPLMNHGEAAVLYCFIFLLFTFTGAGAFSVDNLLAKKNA